MRERLSICLKPATVARVDAVRGLAPRSTIIEVLVNRGLDCKGMDVSHIGGDES